MDGIESPRVELARLLSNTHRDWVRLCVPYAAVDDNPEAFEFDLMDDGGQQHWLALADAVTENGYRRLEPVWTETLANDGRFEYTTSGSCDGSEVWHWYRSPMTQAVEPPSPWEQYTPRPGA